MIFSRVVRSWADSNGGELNRIQVRELIRGLEYQESVMKDIKNSLTNLFPEKDD